MSAETRIRVPFGATGCAAAGLRLLLRSRVIPGQAAGRARDPRRARVPPPPPRHRQSHGGPVTASPRPPAAHRPPRATGAQGAGWRAAGPGFDRVNAGRRIVTADGQPPQWARPVTGGDAGVAGVWQDYRQSTDFARRLGRVQAGPHGAQRATGRGATRPARAGPPPSPSHSLPFCFRVSGQARRRLGIDAPGLAAGPSDSSTHTAAAAGDSEHLTDTGRARIGRPQTRAGTA